MRASIRLRLTLLFFGLVVGPLLIVGVLVMTRVTAEQSVAATDKESQQAAYVATVVRDFIDSLERDLRMTVQVRGVNGLSPEQQQSVLSELRSYQDAFQDLALLDNQGMEMARVSRSQIYEPSDLRSRAASPEWSAVHATLKTYYGPVERDTASNEPLMIIAVPIIDLRSGLVSGALVGEARLKVLREVFARVQPTEGETLYIVDTAHRVVGHQNPSAVLTGPKANLPESNGVATGLDGKRVYLATSTISLDDQALTVVAEKTVEEAQKLTFQTGITLSFVLLGALLVAGGVGFFAIRQIVRPIEQLAATAQAIAGGDLNRQTGIVRSDEIGRLARAFDSMTAQLRQILEGLEQRVRERTAELARRSEQLEKLYQDLQLSTQEAEHRATLLTASARVARAISYVRDLEQLLPEITRLIAEFFNYYHVGVFIMDETSRYAVLRASSSEGGARMLARGHRLAVGQEGMVGYVTGHGQPRVALDVGQDAAHFNNPDLPHTRSEATLPLKVGDRTFGVLDVQSDQSMAFTEGDIAVLSALADQIAIAIENSRLYGQSRAALEEVQQAQRRYLRQEWESLLPTLSRASHEHRASAERSATGDGAMLAVPVKLHEQVIGTIDLPQEAGREWTEEDLALLNAVADQAALALENARLFAQTQQRAQREQMVARIGARIRSGADVDTVLRTTVQEIRRALGVARSTVRLAVDSQANDQTRQA